LLTFESDTEPYAKVRDQEIRKMCGSQEPPAKVESRATHTLFDLDDLYEFNDR